MNVWVIVLGLACAALLVSLVLVHYDLNKEREARRKVQKELLTKLRERLEGFLSRASDSAPAGHVQVEANWSSPYVGWVLELLVETDVSKQMEVRVKEIAERVARDLGWCFDHFTRDRSTGLVKALQFSR